MRICSRTESRSFQTAQDAAHSLAHKRVMHEESPFIPLNSLSERKGSLLMHYFTRVEINRFILKTRNVESFVYRWTKWIDGWPAASLALRAGHWAYSDGALLALVHWVNRMKI
jgi:hypothetical protein